MSNGFNKNKFFTPEEIQDIEDVSIDIIDEYNIPKSGEQRVFTDPNNRTMYLYTAKDGYYISFHDSNGLLIERTRKWIRYVQIRFPFTIIPSLEEFTTDLINLNQRYINMGFRSNIGIEKSSNKSYVITIEK